MRLSAWLLFFHINAVVAIPVSAVSDRSRIVFDQDFDNGSLDIANTVVEEKGDGEPVITLAPRDLSATGRWFHFTVAGVEGRRPTFRVPLSGDARNAHRGDHRYMFCFDGGADYEYFEEAKRTENYYEFGPDEAFPADEVKIAYSLPYPFSRTAEHTGRVAESPWVHPLPGAEPDFHVGRTSGTAGGGYTDELGREVPSLELFAYRITDPAVADDEKEHIVLLSGTHASESTGNFVLEGVVDFLVGEHPAAAEMREAFSIDVYPQVNPEGRWSGYHRTSPQYPSVNYNRDWQEQRNEGLAKVAEAMQRETGGSVAMLVDFHSHRTGFLEIWDGEGGEATPYFKAFQRRRPALKFHRLTAPGAAHMWAKEEEGLNARYSFIAEMGFVAGWKAEDYHDVGRDHALTMHEVLWASPNVGGRGGGSRARCR